ncbi:hypothetical protein LTR56_007349 [Elasticomyces elasticus]|nr:hypothetical protein LTR22_019659 [Elasticomyces elasticus]KAK3648526.1 hypothetical protein LTR56_007349 [Elasticomyces elasticus]KAK4930466.1 hypothetical protein LTR49_002874 [Elasticomyces elasticus]KAK5745062.1 hypothetical protein LTS12_023254 [Elasticomyces elasticus]
MAQPSDTPSLMTIAPELRNAICELYLLNEIKEVHITKSGAIVDQPGLLAVCRQLRAESLPVFQDLAPKFAKSIIIEVHNFDFTGLISFINALDTEQAKAVHKNRNLLFTLGLDQEQVLDIDQAVDGLLVWKAHCDARSLGPPSSNDAGCRTAHADFGKEYRKHVHYVGYLAFKDFLQAVKYKHYGARWISHAESSVEFRGCVDYEKWRSIWLVGEYTRPLMASFKLFWDTQMATAGEM